MVKPEVLPSILYNFDSSVIYLTLKISKLYLKKCIFLVESSAGLLMTTTCSRPSSACSKQNSDSISIESESDLKRYLHIFFQYFFHPLSAVFLVIKVRIIR